MKILVINPGSTSTKIGMFDGDEQIFEKVIRHEREEFESYEKIVDQYDFRKSLVEAALEESGLSVQDFDAIVGMGGLTKPVEGGTFLINEAMVKDLRSTQYGDHASSLGSIIAYEMTRGTDIPPFMVDPVVVDEFADISRISGHPLLPRRSVFHALNQKATAKRYCKEHGKRYDDVNLIVTHMGGGISCGIHNKGWVVDANNALDGDGPFTPERTGTLPVGQLATLCFSGEYTLSEVRAMIKGKGGLVAYTNSNSAKELEERAETNPEARLLIDALAYQVAKVIGEMATVVNGEVDAIILTGGIAYSKYIVGEISKRVSFIAPVHPYPGEDELGALAQGALRVLRGEEKAKIYK